VARRRGYQRRAGELLEIAYDLSADLDRDGGRRRRAQIPYTGPSRRDK
jgi:hypothetical protein